MKTKFDDLITEAFETFTGGNLGDAHDILILLIGKYGHIHVIPRLYELGEDYFVEDMHVKIRILLGIR